MRISYLTVLWTVIPALAQEAGAALNLSDLVREALRSNPEIAAAQKRYEALRQRPTQESSLPDPMFSLGYSSSGSPVPFAGIGKEPTANFGFMVSQEFPWPGKLKLKGDMASCEAGAEFAQYQGVELNVISRLKQAWYRLAKAWAVWDVLGRNRDLLAKFLRMTEVRYSVGKAAQQDVFKAQTQRTILETRLVKLDQETRSREAEIASQLNRAPGAPLGRPEPARPDTPPLPPLEDLYAAARANSPMLARETNLARREYYPDYSLTAGYYYMGSMPPMYMFRADFKLPLYFWRKQRAGAAEQAFQTAQARRSFEATDQGLHFPGLNPDTGNDLEPVYAGDISAMPPGTVQVPVEKQQLIGVQYGRVEAAGGSRTIRAAGQVAIDETRISHVPTRVEGWIGEVFADFTGKAVQKGQPLATLYSPEMLASQRKLLLAVKAKSVMRDNPFPAAVDQSESLVAAARRRLELWDLSGAQIDQVIKTGQPIPNITIHSPASGVITERKAFPNLKVMPDTDLYTIADLGRVWIVADVFEYEARDVRPGQPARVTLSYAPGRAINSRVEFIQPQVDPMTRALKVRLSAENPGMLLKPEMYVDVELRVAMPSQLTVPSGAVLDAGDRQTVFVDRGDGFFEPRRVELGERQGDRVAVLKGLAAGERVVTSGNFLLDSESQLRAAASGMDGPQ